MQLLEGLLKATKLTIEARLHKGELLVMLYKLGAPLEAEQGRGTGSTLDDALAQAIASYVDGGGAEADAVRAFVGAYPSSGDAIDALVRRGFSVRASKTLVAVLQGTGAMVFDDPASISGHWVGGL